MNPTFLFWSNIYFSNFEKRRYKTNQKQQKTNLKYRLCLILKTTNQFCNKNTNYSTKYLLRNKFSVQFSKLTECKIYVLEIKN